MKLKIINIPIKERKSTQFIACAAHNLSKTKGDVSRCTLVFYLLILHFSRYPLPSNGFSTRQDGGGGSPKQGKRRRIPGCRDAAEKREGLFSRVPVWRDESRDERARRRRGGEGKRSRLPVSIDPPRRSRAHLVFHPTSSSIPPYAPRDDDNYDDDDDDDDDEDEEEEDVVDGRRRETEGKRTVLSGARPVCCKPGKTHRQTAAAFHVSMHFIKSCLDQTILSSLHRKSCNRAYFPITRGNSVVLFVLAIKKREDSIQFVSRSTRLVRCCNTRA